MSDNGSTTLIQPAPGTRNMDFFSRYAAYQESLSAPTALAGAAAVPAAAAATTDSVYLRKLTEIPPVAGFDKVPHTVYFYYVRIDTDGKLRVNHYTHALNYPIPPDTIGMVVQQLVDNVRGSNLNPAPDPRNNFQGIEWQRKSYIAVFVDEENWTIHKNGSPIDGIRFVTNLPGTTPNHTFYDAVDLTVDVRNKTTGDITKRSAIAFVNHMKGDANGNDIGQGVRQAFKFEIVFDVKFADGTTAPMTVIFDPEGTNLGPPVGPPF
ncbi:MAG TPA: hypothetical protein VEW26_03315 [Allosphingosinicella sp.]|nr:hypothetical protein [Allosphingosinicella sp.]